MRKNQRVTVILSLVWIATWFSACSAGSGHGMLSLFFPSKQPKATADLPPSTKTRWNSVESQRLATLEADWYHASKVSWHKPYREMMCPECHVIDLRAKARYAPTAVTAYRPELLAPMQSLCKKCHDVPPAPYVHAPVATQNCELCHVPHKSPWPHLLKVKNPDELCLSCHVGDFFTTSQQHEAVSDRSCTTCHDPHSSIRPRFLRTGNEALPIRMGGSEPVKR